MIILDTNVVSELMKPTPNVKVSAWTNAQIQDELFICSPTVFEIEFGIRRLPDGDLKSALQRSWERIWGERFADHCIPITCNGGRQASIIRAQAVLDREPTDLVDTLIAGAAAERKAKVATRNTRHFPKFGLAVIDPWTA